MEEAGKAGKAGKAAKDMTLDELAHWCAKTDCAVCRLLLFDPMEECYRCYFVQGEPRRWLDDEEEMDFRLEADPYWGGPYPGGPTPCSNPFWDGYWDRAD